MVIQAGAEDVAETTPAATEADLPSRREQRERERRENGRPVDFEPDTLVRDDEDDDGPTDELQGDELRAAMRGTSFTDSPSFTDSSFSDSSFTDVPEREPASQTPLRDPIHDDSLFVPSTIDDDISAQPLLAMTLKELEPPFADSVDDSAPGPRRASFHTNADSSIASLSSLAEEIEPAPEREVKKQRTYTGAVWAIAAMPVLQLIASIALLYGGFGNNLPLMLIVWFGPYLVVLGLAAYDRLAQQVWGHKDIASPWWAALTAPVYLVVRAVRSFRETGKGFAPIGLWGAGVLAVLVGVIALPGLLISVLPSNFSAEAEQSIASDAATFGGDITLDCPASPPVFFGQLFTCIGEKANGETDSIAVSLQRENGWIGWRVEDWGSWDIRD